VLARALGAYSSFSVDLPPFLSQAAFLVIDRRQRTRSMPVGTTMQLTQKGRKTNAWPSAAFSRERSFFARATLAIFAYLIQTGEVELLSGPPENLRRVAKFGPKEVFGEHEPNRGTGAALTARAMGAGKVLSMSRSEFERLLNGRSGAVAFITSSRFSSACGRWHIVTKQRPRMAHRTKACRWSPFIPCPNRLRIRCPRAA